MRTNVIIDDKLIAEALAATGAKTKREVVEMGLEALIGRKERIEALNKLWGIDLHWGEFPDLPAADA